MQYKILARKWRPKSFSEVVGQKYTIQAIINGFKLNRIQQSWIISGTRGIGKTTIARLLAKTLNCNNRKQNYSCNTCINCKEIENGCFQDLLEIDAASKTRVEDIKEILETVKYQPIQGKYKVYLIDEVHMLSKHSFNALLKILEEPPEYVKFILITTEINKLPNTIISRCIHFNLKKIHHIQISKFLIKILKLENIHFEISAIKTISYYSHGSIRDALNLTEQIILITNENITKKSTIKIFRILNTKTVLNIITSILNKNTKKLTKILKLIYQLDIELEEIFTKILSIFHKIAIFKKIPKYLNNINLNYKKQIIELSNIIDYNRLKKYYKIILDGKKELYLFINKKIGIEMTLLNLLDAVNKNNI